MVRRALVAAVLGSLILLVGPAPAFAHAQLLRSVPRNGSVVPTAPVAITLTFGEAVSIGATPPRLTDARGAQVPATATMEGATMRIQPAARLGVGPAAVSYEVISEDGHEVTGAIAFVVGGSTARGPAQVVAAIPKVPTRLNGSRRGQLTVTFARASTSGEVVWTGPGVQAPIRWRVTTDKKTSSATGVLPYAGAWQMSSTLQGAGATVIVVRGSVTLR